MDGFASVKYWKGRDLARLGSNREAKRLYREVVEEAPRSYYGLRALQRLHRKMPRSILKDWWAKPIRLRWSKERIWLGDLSHWRRIEELKELGLGDDLNYEVRLARTREGLPLLEGATNLKRKRGGWLVLHRNPREFSSIYQIPHAALLFNGTYHSPRVDSYFLYAVMRQESHFRESAVSPAGAIGLMQITPETGRRLAHQMGWSDYDERWLSEPITNIELSLSYFRELEALFPDRWYAVAAAYNAGEFVVKGWLSLKPDLPEEEMIEEIPYAETRDYVKKVYTNWQAYRWIYH
jgi:soluble lytic murein transglycosylase